MTRLCNFSNPNQRNLPCREHFLRRGERIKNDNYYGWGYTEHISLCCQARFFLVIILFKLIKDV